MKKDKSSENAESAPPKKPHRKVKGADTNPQLANLIPFEPGKSGNPAGKKLGTRNRRTVMEAALRRIAEKKNMTPEEVEDAIQVAGIEKALKGSYLHYSEVNINLYGKATDNVDITSKGKSIADIVLAAHGKRAKR